MKRRQILLIQILLMIIATLLIPLNLLYVKFSEWVVIIPLIGIILNSFMYYRTCKWVGRVFLIILTVFVIGVVFIGSFANPYWNSSTFRSDYTTEAIRKF